MSLPLLRCLATVIAATPLLAGCAGQPRFEFTSLSQDARIPAASGAISCRQRLGAATGPDPVALDPDDIRLINWNIQKSQNESSLSDLDTLAADSDLVLIQEATLASGLADTVESAQHWSFAPGYETREFTSGVMTLSAARPLNRCNLVAFEPWLRSPKATSVTEYALAGSDETLVVVNTHAVNFTIGTRRFREQLEDIATALRDHSGPVILSGDFNTWRVRRMQIVNEISADLGLSPVRFRDDKRAVRFGHTLDHVYVRGLGEVEASTHVVSTSDHNPMLVRFSRAQDDDGRAMY